MTDWITLIGCLSIFSFGVAFGSAFALVRVRHHFWREYNGPTASDSRAKPSRPAPVCVAPCPVCRGLVCKCTER